MNRRDWAALVMVFLAVLGFIFAIVDIRTRGFQLWWAEQGAAATMILAITLRVVYGWFARRRGLSAPRTISWLFIFVILVHMMDMGIGWRRIQDVLAVAAVFFAYYEDKFWKPLA